MANSPTFVRVTDYNGPEHATPTRFPESIIRKNLNIKIQGLADATEGPVQILNMQGQNAGSRSLRKDN